MPGKKEAGGDEEQTQETDFVAFNKETLFKKLPVEEKALEILYAIEKNDATIVVGETGSGKSTKLP